MLRLLAVVPVNKHMKTAVIVFDRVNGLNIFLPATRRRLPIGDLSLGSGRGASGALVGLAALGLGAALRGPRDRVAGAFGAGLADWFTADFAMVRSKNITGALPI